MGREIIKLQVKEILKERGMTGKDLAQKMGVKSSYLYNVIGNAKGMSLNALVNIAETLGVEFSELFIPPTQKHNGALDSLKRLLVSEISFPADASPRIVGFLLDAIKENTTREEWLEFLRVHIRNAFPKNLFEKCKILMKADTAEDVELAILN